MSTQQKRAHDGDWQAEQQTGGMDAICADCPHELNDHVWPCGRCLEPGCKCKAFRLPEAA